MARTVLSATVASTSGIRVHTGFDVAADVTNGNEFDNDGNVFLLVRNSDGSVSHTVTFYAQGLIDGSSIPVKSVAIAANLIKWFGPFAPSRYNQANGRIPIDADSAAVFYQVLRIPKVS